MKDPRSFVNRASAQPASHDPIMLCCMGIVT